MLRPAYVKTSQTAAALTRHAATCRNGVVSNGGAAGVLEGRLMT
ncbi:MAG: hypothetical protein JWR14_516, partial [Caballeronia sp.]|nr:hypothetical protein [Caballeronia sp.]